MYPNAKVSSARYKWYVVPCINILFVLYSHLFVKIFLLHQGSLFDMNHSANVSSPA